MENLPTGYPNLQNERSENDIYNYIVKNVKQPLEIIIENSVVEDFLQDRDCSIDIDQNNCVTHCEKFSNENMRIPRDTTCEGEIPLAEFQSPSLETAITTEIRTVDNIEQSIAIAPGEGKKPISILNDIYCEEMAHPHLFPTGKFGYKVKREVPLTPCKYFNQRLLNYSQHFASDPDYIFFADLVMQKIQLNDQISTSMRKVTSNSLNAGMLSSNFKATVQQFIAQGKAYSFMSSIKGTPAYWAKSRFVAKNDLFYPKHAVHMLAENCPVIDYNELMLNNQSGQERLETLGI